ncbi:MAG: hypothetical protein KME03_02635 [Aphanocapsa lilacina HA4352-LM1]|nr:hypothetical protein [Aphanocapsa lilacina HA4352-LM1]
MDTQCLVYVQQLHLHLQPSNQWVWNLWSLHLAVLTGGLLLLGLYVLFQNESRAVLPADHFTVLAVTVIGGWLLFGSALQVWSYFG